MAQSKEGETIKGEDFSAQFNLLSDSTIYVDSNGDLDLIVHQGDQSKTFCVSSQVLRLASPVWRTMLDPGRGFKEGLPDGDHVDFYDDDFEALFIVLLASHLRSQEIPDQIGFRQLFELCTVCDKYDCISVLQPWFQRWQKEWVHCWNSPEWPFIAWVLGDEESFKRATDLIVMECKVNDAEQCLNKRGVVLDDHFPPGLEDSIREARSATLTKLIEVCHSLVCEYSSKNRRVCKTVGPWDECDALNFGHLVRSLQKLEIWPGDPKDIVNRMKERSVEEVSGDIRKIESYTYPPTPGPYDPYRKTNYEHDDCGFESTLHQHVHDLLSKDFGVVEPSQGHLNAQRQKLKPTKLDPSKFQKGTTSTRS